MIPSVLVDEALQGKVYQRGLVIDSQLKGDVTVPVGSVSKGIGD